LGPEATAAVIGALAGGGIAYLAAGANDFLRRRRERRIAAQLIFAELVIGAAEAKGALLAQMWPNIHGGPRRAAWDAYGRFVMPRRGVEGVGVFATAYSALDDIAWLASTDNIDPNEDYSLLLQHIDDGLNALARQAGLGQDELDRRLELGEKQTAKAQAEIRQLRRWLDTAKQDKPSEE
jgi:hypothetical protein